MQLQKLSSAEADPEVDLVGLWDPTAGSFEVDADLGRDTFQYLLNEEIQSTLSLRKTVGHLLPCLVRGVATLFVRDFHRNHPFGLVKSYTSVWYYSTTSRGNY